MASNVTVAYLADVTDLRTKSALAKSALADVNAEVRKQAEAVREASDETKSSAIAALQSLTAEQAKLRSEIAATTREIKGQSATVEEHTGILSKLHESVKLTGERFEHLRVSLGVYTEAAKAIGEFVLVGLGLEKINDQVKEFAETAIAMSRLSEATGLTTANLYALRDVATMADTPFETLQGDLTKLTRSMEQAAENADSEAGRAFAAMGIKVRDTTTGALRPMGAVLDELAVKLTTYQAGTGKAALELGVFGRSGTDLNSVLQELAKTGLAGATSESERLGTAIGPEAVEAAKKYEESVHRLSIEWHGFANTVLEEVVPALAKVAAAMGPTLDEEIDSTKNALQQMQHENGNMATFAWFDHLVSGAMGSKDAVETLQERLTELEKRKAELDSQQHDVTKTTIGTTTLKPGSEPAPSIGPSGADEVKQFEAELLAKQTAEGKYHAMSAAEEAKFWQGKIAITVAGSEARREVEQKFYDASRQAASQGARAEQKEIRDTWEQYSAATKEKIAEDKGHFDAQIALASAWVEKAKELYGQDTKQYYEALEAKNALLREQQTQALTIAQDMATAQENLDKIGGGGSRNQFKPSMADVFDPGALEGKVDTEIAHLREVLDEKLAALKADLQGKLSIGDAVGAAADYKDATAALEEFATKAKDLNQQAADAIAASWEKITGPIGNAFDQALGVIVKGGRNTGLELDHIAEGIVESWAKSAVKVVTDWAAAEAEKTILSATGNAARQAIGGDSEAKDVAALAQQLAKFIATETGKTGATAAGVAARTGITAAGAAASKSAEAAAGSTTVMSAAAKAAAGAYSSVAQIPYVGWILAPAAAAAAFTAVAAYQVVASAEGGQERVPYDGQITELHKNEMVLPASIAESVRSMAAGGVRAPAQASAALGGSSSMAAMGGDVSHSLEFNQTNHINATESGEDIEKVLNRQQSHFESTAKSWYGNTGAQTLPGRRVRR